MAIFRGIGGAGDSTTDATLTAVTQQATNAASSATAASSSASAAATSASSASTSASNAASSEVSGAVSATSATASATSATASKVAAAASEIAAGASETAAAASESAAATSASNAASSASSASASASTATTQASSATSSAATATTKASEAVTSASNAATSETNAASSASAAASSASSASASADAALTALDNFDDRYLGQKASDPTVDNDGNALVAGALYFNTTDSVMKVYEGSIWVAAYASLSGALIAANNLSDLASVIAARTNLGLGTAATTDATDYATAAQGATADTAVQPNDTVSFAGLTYTGTLTGGTGVVNIGSGQVYKDGSGNLGVGTSSPTGKFHVVGGRSNFAANSENYAVYLQYNSATSGFYVGSPSADAMAFSASSGAERMRIDSAGNVGIGTSSPAAPLDVAGKGFFRGAGSFEALELITSDTNRVFITGNSSVTGDMWRVGTSASNPHLNIDALQSNGEILLRTGGTNERVRIDDAGNVGIGTSSPVAKLDVKGGTSNASDLATAYSLAAFNIQPKSTSGYSLQFGSGPSDFPYVQMSAAGAAAGGMTLQPYGGNVGIGTSALPQAKLSVYGATENQIRVTDDPSYYYSIGRSSTQGFLTFYGSQAAATGYIFTGAAGERMRIDASGNVGIGTSSPNSKLNVNGRVFATGSLTSNSGDPNFGAGGSRAFMDWDGSKARIGTLTGGGSGGPIGFFVNNSELASLDTSGNFTAAGNVTAYSDERLKKDWEEVKPNFVDQLANVKSGTYTRTDSDARQAGVSAQSLQELLPETVMAGEDGMLSVAYGNAAMVAVVELAKEVRKLKEELRALKGV